MRAFVLALSTLMFCPLWAQSDFEVPEVKVVGAAKSSSLDSVPTVNEISGARLRRKRQSSLGETLSHETGVTSTQFGPAASRPVIRGQEGDRVRIMQNGVGVIDASSASQDHAVAVEPLVVERIEVVRGPGALLYGTSVVGGVVNVSTTRIPEKIPPAFNARAETRFGSGDQARGGGVSLNSAAGAKFAVHADGAARAADNYRARKDEPVVNSYSRSGSAAGGAAYVGERGFVGGSFSNLESTYGTVAEEFVHVNMLQQRFDLAAEVKDWAGMRSLRASAASTSYKHDEIENGELGTTFKNDGHEGRLELRNPAVFGFVGMFGLQQSRSDFSAEGEESFLPKSQTDKQAIFLFEEKQEGRFRPSFGARFEQTEVNSQDGTLGPGQSRRFNNSSAAVGFTYDLTSHYTFAVNGSMTERAPSSQELFAQGNHVATATYELGERNLGAERSRSVEATIGHNGALGQGRAGVFIQDYRDYILLAPTGGSRPAPESLPEFRYSATNARFYGAELEYRHNISQLVPSGKLDFELRFDWLRGEDRNTGNNLPRITPMRETLAFIYKAADYQTDLELQRSERQTRLAPNEYGTGDYTLVNIGVEQSVAWEKLNLNIFARVNNVFDVEARNHVSLLKDRAPLPGRNIVAGLQATF